MKNHHTGWRRLLSAAHYSKQGFISSWRSEAAIRQEIVALCFLVPIAFIVEVSPVERALLILICTSNSGHFTKHCSLIQNSLG